MTPREIQVLDYVREFIAQSGLSPTMRGLAGAMNLSVGNVHRIVDGLVRQGALTRAANRTRSLAIAGTPDLRVVPTDVIAAELARRGVTLASLMPRERPALGRAVSCAADTCGSEVKPGMLMCRTHWFALPRELQDRIRLTFSRRDVSAYQAAVSEARDLIDSGSWRARA